MKKVLLTKTHLNSVISTADVIKKAPNGVATSTKVNSTGAHIMHMKTNVITNTYIQRKSFQYIYGEIFKLLMRLPDKALQERVIDAMNDSCAISGSYQCRQCSINNANNGTQKVNVSTQTETLETKELTKVTNESSPSGNMCSEISPISSLPADSIPTPISEKETKVSNEALKPEIVKRKRGRKRNTCGPKVVKRSSAQMALQDREDKLLTPLASVKRKKTAETTGDFAPRDRRDSGLSNLSGLSDINATELCDNMENYIRDDNQTTIYTTMKKEFMCADIISEEGLLPIHYAILVGDINRVQRQIYVWSKLKNNVDIDGLLTADEEDCLQLALTNDCESEIVKIVLNAGVLPNHIYQDSNTALHIAIINNVKLESLRHLIRMIDLNLLIQTNDEGYTALHIAVRHNRYKMAEVICDIIDERQFGEPIYKRAAEKAEESNNDNGAEDEKKFAKFYEHACDRLENSKSKLLRHQLKHEILNASEARSGNGSLFYAIEGEHEHLCYFLLAHLTNPDEENHSGHSPRSYHYEFARVLRINLKIARIMDKVHRILNCAPE